MRRENTPGQNGVSSPVLRYVLRHHPRDLSAAGLMLQGMVQRELPGDDFSLSQWQLGLDYYRGRLAELGMTGKVLLDIGCGSGNWAAAAATGFALVVGCDTGATRLACGRHILTQLRMQNAHLCRAEATQLPIASGAVDCALVYNLLPYVKGWRRLLPELARVVKPGGRVFAGWQEAGMMVFCLAEGVLMRRAWRLLDVWSIAQRRLAKPREAAPLTLAKEAVVREFTRANFRLLRAPRNLAFSARLFPRRFCFLPFFYEALFERQS